MSHSSDTNQHQSASVRTYVIGFSSALILTLAAYIIVVNKLLTGNVLVGSLLGLGIIQTVVQLWYFLHLGREEKPRWNTIFLFNTIGIIILIVAASIWVMNSLNYRMMSPEQMIQYSIEEGSKGF